MTNHTSLLQPMSMAQLLDRAIRLYRKNFLLFIGIVAVAQIPATAVNMIGLWLAPTPELPAFDPTPTLPEMLQDIAQSSGLDNNPWVWFGRLITLLLLQIATAALTKAVAENYLGHKISLLEAYRKIGRSGLTLLFAVFLSFLFIIALFVWWIFVPILGWLSGLGMIFFFALVVLPLIAPVIVLEHRTATEAIQRAWDLARRRIWWLIGFMLLLGLFGQLVVTLPAILSVFIINSVVGSSVSATTTTLIQQVIGLLLNLIYLPLQLTCVTLLYFDVRVRTEGFDLALLALSDETHADAVQATAPPLDSTRFPKWEEIGYFSLLTIAFVVLYVAIIMVFLLIFLGSSGLSGGF
ncbi:hypothetical protein MNBD_CHLOROFLEXI01-1670 [hydrothermal vent metagenome]|uniref:Transmembrane protein n=1 Tax=hydrothermal vent metagenome TaxID=652676 RepID=A0A3B0UWT8_9ZZZZ